MPPILSMPDCANATLRIASMHMLLHPCPSAARAAGAGAARTAAASASGAPCTLRRAPPRAAVSHELTFAAKRSEHTVSCRPPHAHTMSECGGAARACRGCAGRSIRA